MSHPPNSAEIIQRAPQHGIVVHSSATRLPTSNMESTHPPTSGSQPRFANNKTYCSEPSCGNAFAVQPYGMSPDDDVFIKIRCAECQPVIMIPLYLGTNERSMW
ncbi:predicted protein [Plenodomus lingam JN3]|uniref:Predicted protein n=1 Tax=Leptosphaeria maculans (strain JN3 / isolate v23.1.3 / race Av1-4-5-6-7-8) TaxID=985895 RepID=E4ZK66_LEPMJ|nr:predicted protein [Plenodomus lingam JN3]CBX91661.1 predicted protein [Plenodomus lingam JN3]